MDHAAPPPLAHQEGPPVPEGWLAQWSPDHNAWYYVNTITKVSIWEPPTQPATASPAPAPAPVPTGLPTPGHGGDIPQPGQEHFAGTPQQQQHPDPAHAAAALATPPYPGQEHHQQQQQAQDPHAQPPSYFGAAPTDPHAAGYDVTAAHAPAGATAQPGVEGEGDRGFGKVVMGTGVGLMVNQALHDIKKDLKHGKFNFGKYMGGGGGKPHHGGGHAAGATTIISEQHHHYHQQQSPPPPQQYQHGGYQPPYQQPPQHQAQHYAGAAVAGAAIGAGAGYMAGNHHAGAQGNFHGSPPPPPGAGPGAYGYVAPQMGMGGPPPGIPVTIVSANFGGDDVTDKVRGLVKTDGTLDLNDHGDGGQFDRWLGDPWCGVKKSLCILYQFGNGPFELMITRSGGGTGQRIDSRDPPRPIRRAFITEFGPVIAVVWGIMEGRDQPVAPDVIKHIAEYRPFTANNDFFKFNGYPSQSKTAVVFYRKPSGEIGNIGVREDGMATL